MGESAQTDQVLPSVRNAVCSLSCTGGPMWVQAQRVGQGQKKTSDYGRLRPKRTV